MRPASISGLLAGRRSVADHPSFFLEAVEMTHAGVTFSLFAPHNKWVNLLGDWNDWESVPMEQDDSGWWKLELQLPDGEYLYKFETESNSFFARGERVAVADPRASRLSRDTYENAILRVKDGRPVVTSYTWVSDDVPLPDNLHLVIYEMHIGDFRGGPGDEQAGPGTFARVIERLDHLSHLGVNALEIMPVTEFPGDRNWGYMPRSLFAVENSYGDPDELCRLVDECHGRGIRVILDGVYNHADPAHPLAQIDHGYWFHDVNPDEPEAQFGPKFDYGRYDKALGVWPAREYVRDAIFYWLDHFHIDGIRFDATAVIDDVDMLTWLRHSISEHIEGRKPFFAIAEHVPEDPSVVGLSGPMDAAWHELFCMQMSATLSCRPLQERPPFSLDAVLQVLDPRRQGYDSAFDVINYLDSHDHDRIMWKLGEAGILDGAAFRRLRLGAALVFTAPGIPMVWMGQEFGVSAEKSPDSTPLDWSLLGNEANASLLDLYRRMIGLRRSVPALAADTFALVFRDDARSLLAWKRWLPGDASSTASGAGAPSTPPEDEGASATDGVVMVLANLKDEAAGDVEVPDWPGDGPWHELIYDYEVTVHEGVLHDWLGSSEIKVYVRA